MEKHELNTSFQPVLKNMRFCLNDDVRQHGLFDVLRMYDLLLIGVPFSLFYEL